MAFSLLLTAFLAAQALAADVVALPATHKVVPPLGDQAWPAQATLHAARGEWESFQVLVRGTAGAQVTAASMGAFDGPSGPDATPPRVDLYREWFLDITTPSFGGVTGDERVAGRYPDPLIPLVDPYGSGVVGLPFALDDDGAGAGFAVLFVDVLVPRDAAPGAHTATLSLTVDGEALTVPVTLDVWDFELPVTRTVATAYGFSHGAPRDYHGGPGAVASADYDTIVDRYYDVLHENRVDPQDIPGSDVNFTFDADGALEPVDWTAFDAAVAPWLDGSRFADGAGLNRFNTNLFSAGRGTGAWTDAQYSAAAKAYAEHLESKGWWSHAYSYSIDEPWMNGGDQAFADIHADAQRLMAGSPLWANHLLVTGPYEEPIRDDIGIWTPVTPMYGDWFYTDGRYPGRDLYKSLIAEGKELWFYVCNANLPPYAGYDIDTHIGFEPRIAQWGAWAEGATGFLFWRVTYWPHDDPWNVFSNPEVFTQVAARNGDGVLLYPGDHDGLADGRGSPSWLKIDGPIVSYRLKQIRDGMEDWELFRLATDLGGGDFVREQVARAYTRFGDFFMEDCYAYNHACPDDLPWTRDEVVLQDVRDQVSAEIQFLQHPDLYPDPAVLEPDVDDAEPPRACGCAASGTREGALVAGATLLLLGRRRRR